MNRPKLFVADQCGVMINCLSQHVEDAAEALRANRNLDRRACIVRIHAAHETVGRAHSDAARDAVAKVLHDLDREIDVNIPRLALDGNGIQNCGKLARREFNIYDRSDDLYDFAFCQ